MNKLITLAFLFFTTVGYSSNNDLEAPVVVNDDMTPTDYTVGKQFNVSQLKINQAKRRLFWSFDSSKEEQRVKKLLVHKEKLSKEADQAVKNLLTQANVVMKAMGSDEGEKILAEYELFYSSHYQNIFLGAKGMGDHKPMSEWLVKVHNTIEQKVGVFLCKFFKFHDIFIINYGVPVVLAPESFEFPEYKLHFAGLLYDGSNKWVHHGVAGVVTYWAVNIACQAGTAGLGAITFACGPISSLSQNFMDRRLAPPIAKRIWENNQL